MESKAIDRLKSIDLKVTPIRVRLLSLLSENEKAVSHSMIQDLLHDFDRITLYRTLNTFLNTGLIHKAIEDKNDVFYALCDHNCSSQGHSHQHIHFKCKNCKQVFCVQTKKSIVLEVPGYFIDRFDVEALGICATCMK